MGMNVGGSDDSAMCDINTTPLIDVMLVLLIMFIITIPVMTHAVNVQPEVIDIEIDFDGTVVWNGTPIQDINILERYFRVESQKDPQPELHLRPDKRAKYDTVAKVLASAQRNRMKKIGFVNVAEFGD